MAIAITLLLSCLGLSTSTLPEQQKLTLNLCLILPFESLAYSQREVTGLLAAKHINTRNYSFVANNTQASLIELPQLEVVVHPVHQGGTDVTFQRATDCINNGADAIIGPAYSSRTAPVSKYLLSQRFLPAVTSRFFLWFVEVTLHTYYLLSQVGFSATSPDLSDPVQFPFFARTVPPDDEVSKAALVFVMRAGWKRVAFLYSNDSFGRVSKQLAVCRWCAVAVWQRLAYCLKYNLCLCNLGCALFAFRVYLKPLWKQYGITLKPAKTCKVLVVIIKSNLCRQSPAARRCDGCLCCGIIDKLLCVVVGSPMSQSEDPTSNAALINDALKVVRQAGAKLIFCAVNSVTLNGRLFHG